ncbi:alanine--glyoxylate aminotransferase family protein [Bacteroides sp. 224]|uniref:pyridoxal-phosphate-dependent aminotransferase family protein n=1 Tax=Bacteroides sp. 224 TaxID=2302936 RepID=UPI0013D01DB6|nr:aminotransferase class V-fold PLP-dependent enzyme [Bacteroides sp. 224]NDV64291.1 alanine--glyoxylate aminotransferase family protein [Bacteroides sp. 224]
MKLYVFPGNIEEEILQIGAQQIPYMRTAMFSEIVKDSERMLLELINCKQGRVIPLTASGTGAMDAVVTNFVCAKKSAFIIAGGSFGYRWKDLCDYYNCPNTVFEVPFAKDIDYSLLEQEIEKHRPEVLLCQHHETSSGQLFNLTTISEICRKYNVTLVVDAISSFLTDDLDMDEMGIGICIISSQKGLNIPPGLSFIVLSEEICKQDFLHNSYYFDFEENLKNLQRGQTPYSPATTLFLQLHHQLKKDMQLGTDKIKSLVREKALYFRKLCKQNNWEVPAEVPSNCITGFFVRRNSDILFTELLKQNIYIMPGGTPGYFRVSHSGVQSYSDLDYLAEQIKQIENLNK